MSYTDRRQKRPPRPSVSEQEFAQLNDDEREMLTIAWLLKHGHRREAMLYQVARCMNK